MSSSSMQEKATRMSVGDVAMTPKRVKLDKDSRGRRLALIKERYEAVVLGLRQDGEMELTDAFLEEEDFEPAVT